MKREIFAKTIIFLPYYKLARYTLKITNDSIYQSSFYNYPRKTSIQKTGKFPPGINKPFNKHAHKNTENDTREKRTL